MNFCTVCFGIKKSDYTETWYSLPLLQIVVHCMINPLYFLTLPSINGLYWCKDSDIWVLTCRISYCAASSVLVDLNKRTCSIKVVVMWKCTCGNGDLMAAHTTCSTQNMMQELLDNHIISVNVWSVISTGFWHPNFIFGDLSKIMYVKVTLMLEKLKDNTETCIQPVCK